MKSDLLAIMIKLLLLSSSSASLQLLLLVFFFHRFCEEKPEVFVMDLYVLCSV